MPDSMPTPKRICIIMNTSPGGLSYRRERLRRIFAQFQKDLQATHPFEFDTIPFYAIGSTQQGLPKIDSYDAYVLSGSSSNLSERGIPELYAKEIELVKRTAKPVFGICFGHHVIAFAHGFSVCRMKDQTAETNDAEITLALLRGFLLTPKKAIKVQVFHGEEVAYSKELEKTFFLLASSEHCKVHIIQHKTLPQFGVQFHPEASDKAGTQVKMNGEEILCNFVKFAVEYHG